VLPGGRFLTPLGRQGIIGPGAFGIAISPSGRYIVTANIGPNRYSFSVVEKDKARWKVQHHIAPRPDELESEIDEDVWRSVSPGIAFQSERHIFASEGNSGRVMRIDVRSGDSKLLVDLNQGNFADSYTGELAYDPQRQILYVVDQANFRIAVVDAGKRRVVASVRTGRLPFAAALSPDHKRLWVTNLGIFEYKSVPGADRQRARETGLPFPAFGFPSPEASMGVKRQNGAGEEVQVPGLGDPNAPESNSVCVINVENPAEPRVEKFIRTGLPFGKNSHGGSSPSGITVTAERAFVSNTHNDSISVINTATLEVEKEVLMRIPGLEAYRGLLPVGSTYHAGSGWLFVAAAGINALAVIDTRRMETIGYLPVAWFPTRVAQFQDVLYVACAKGYGTGANASRRGPETGNFHGERRRGAINVFPVPDESELRTLTTAVFTNNGFLPAKTEPPPAPAAIEHVVVIVKENRTFDEVFGDLERSSNGPVNGLPILARFGRYGVVNQRRGELQTRLGLRDLNVTPNHHALALRFAFSDNFYASSEMSVDGHHWLVGSYPNAWTQSSLMASDGALKDFRLSPAPGRLLFAGDNSSVHPEEQPEAGTLWHHLERNGIPFRNFGEGFELAGVDHGVGLEPSGARALTNVPMPDPLYRNTSRNYPPLNMNIPDQYRATQFIKELDEMFVKPDRELPRLLYIHLPNDHMARPRPEDGYPFEASYVADNDYALGRIVEYLSRSKWWPKMAILVSEDDAQGGVDHVDSHRTVLLAISPYVKRNYASHINSSFPGLLKTVFHLLRIPPLNLFDATAAGLTDCFTDQPDFTPYKVVPVPKELFDPATARAAQPGESTPLRNDPRVPREQHRRQ
jgi:DNA-binding beta-propeller fold protein YncE